jgi:hypothetical protein
MLKGTFIYLDAATINTMLTEWQACLTAIATAHQSYSMAGRTFTRANLAEVAEMVGELAYAKELKAGNVVRSTVADMSNTPG